MRGVRVVGVAVCVLAVAGCSSKPSGLLLKRTGQRIPLVVASIPQGLRAGHLWCERVRIPTAHGTRFTVALHMENFLETTSEKKRFLLRHLDVQAGGRTYPGTVSLSVPESSRNCMPTRTLRRSIGRPAGLSPAPQSRGPGSSRGLLLCPSSTMSQP